MSFWKAKENSQKEFAHGQEAFDKAVEASLDCGEFKIDDEDELVIDQDRSCYNCRYRRWTMDTFVCVKE